VERDGPPKMDWRKSVSHMVQVQFPYNCIGRVTAFAGQSNATGLGSSYPAP